MSDLEILKEIKKIFVDNFQMNADEININTGMNDIVQWSSLTHIFIIDNIESTFNIQFTPSDIEKSINVNQLINIVKNKTK
jgi:acyl carrier protein